jgi:histidinol-phosphate phosphatase family protein
VLDRLRAEGVAVGIVTNQSGIARGLFGEDDLARVHARVEELLGPFGAVEHCPHGEADGCACRKPRPGLVLAAAARLGVDPAACVVIGDIGADLAAAEAAGARGVLVPTPATRPEEVHAAARVARDLGEAVRRWVLPDAIRPDTGAAPAGAAGRAVGEAPATAAAGW